MSQLSWFTLGLIFGVSVTLIGLTVGLILRDRKKREHYFSPPVQGLGVIEGIPAPKGSNSISPPPEYKD